MYIANNDLNLTGITGNKENFASTLLKKSEKEPTKVLENLTQDLRTEKDSTDTNQKSLEEVRSSDTVRELFEKQNEGNVVNDHHYGDKGINETQLNNAEGQRNDEYFSSGLSLFTREVYPKMKERMKKNEEFYNMPENKKRVGDGDVVSSGAKSVKVVKAGAKSVKVVKAQYAQPLPSVDQSPEVSMTEYPASDISQTTSPEQSSRQVQPQEIHQTHQQSRQNENNKKSENKEVKEDSNAPKKHSLKFWNHVTKEWSTIAEHDDAKELEQMKEKAIQQYYNGSEFEGKNAPFEIFVNEHVKRTR